MKIKIKYFSIGLLMGCVLMVTTPVLADSIIQKIDVVMNGVNVQVDGQELDSSSILYNGSTYLPLRKVAEAVGKDVVWNQDTMTANIVDTANIETESIKEGDNLDEFKIYNIDDGFNCYAERNGEIYFHANNIVRQMNENGKNGDYGIDINNLANNNVRLFDKDNGTIIENVPYEMIQNRIFISKTYYENTILPLIK
jgi:hypothetical protein